MAVRRLVRTVARSVAAHEGDKVKGSRFIASVERVGSQEAARAFVKHVRTQLPQATHYAVAWRIDDSGATSHCDDDREVSGTAGQPILARLEGEALQQTVVVVTRYYGGTKLGRGGLVRAYGAAASAGLAEAGIVEIEAVSTWRIAAQHSSAGRVRGIVQRYGGQVVHSSYEDESTATDAPLHVVELPLLATAHSTTPPQAWTAAHVTAPAGYVVLECELPIGAAVSADVADALGNDGFRVGSAASQGSL